MPAAASFTLGLPSLLMSSFFCVCDLMSCWFIHHDPRSNRLYTIQVCVNTLYDVHTTTKFT
jgi:hypothetical protein